MELAIYTRLFASTEAYVVASRGQEHLRVECPADYNVDLVHTEAAQRLARKLYLRGAWCGGIVPEGRVFVRVLRADSVASESMEPGYFAILT